MKKENEKEEEERKEQEETQRVLSGVKRGDMVTDWMWDEEKLAHREGLQTSSPRNHLTLCGKEWGSSFGRGS